jgi:hypothetical protein
MQLSKIAIAVAAVCAATAATAAPDAGRVAKSAGASAVQTNVRLAVESLCSGVGKVPTSFVSGNFTTVVCADVALTAATYVSKPNADFKDFNGLPFAEIRFNVSNGSFGSVQILNGVPFNFRNPGTGLNTDPTPGGVVIGGISDVETNRFPSTVIGSNTLAANTKLGAAQVFGVAASIDLYTKMFDAQKLAGLIPAVCTVNSTALSYCIPNIAKAQMATIMSANDLNAAYAKGLEFLTNDPADNAVELRYVRRVDTSGTQASAQNYFLGLPCSFNQLSIVAEPTTIDAVGGTIANAKIENIRVYGAGGTSNVLTQLNQTDADLVAPGIQPGVYALGVVSGENNQTGQTWRWLRVDGAPIGENAVPATAGITNSSTMKTGAYSFFFEATYTGGNGTNDGYWATIATAFGGLPAPVGLVNQATLDLGYNKGGQTCLGSSSN